MDGNAIAFRNIRRVITAKSEYHGVSKTDACCFDPEPGLTPTSVNMPERWENIILEKYFDAKLLSDFFLTCY